MKILGGFVVVLAVLLCFAGSGEAVIVLDFEGINKTYPSAGTTHVLDFYNGGTSSDGTSGTNFGIAFTSNALTICLNTPGTVCSNTSRGGLAPGSDKGALFFLFGSQTFMNIAAGFDTGFAFFYSAIHHGGSVSVFDGLNGTGTLLATLGLPTTPSACGPQFNAGFCPFVPIGIGFAGIAKSVSFAGAVNHVVFDDITFGSITPGPGVPEPASLILLGIGLAGLAGLGARGRKTSE